MIYLWLFLTLQNQVMSGRSESNNVGLLQAHPRDLRHSFACLKLSPENVLNLGRRSDKLLTCTRINSLPCDSFSPNSVGKGMHKKKTLRPRMIWHLNQDLPLAQPALTYVTEICMLSLINVFSDVSQLLSQHHLSFGMWPELMKPVMKLVSDPINGFILRLITFNS